MQPTRVAYTSEEKHLYMRKLLDTLLDALVEDHDCIYVQEVRGSYNTVYEVLVDNNYAGFVLGQQGANVQALRTIMMAAAKKVGGFKLTVDVNPVDISVVERKQSTHESDPFDPAEDEKNKVWQRKSGPEEGGR